MYDIARVMMSTVKTERLLQSILFSLISHEGDQKYSRAILFPPVRGRKLPRGPDGDGRRRDRKCSGGSTALPGT
jgi:hypothetical protein